ncbi:MAG: hypothetical protein ACOYN3_09375, partial [Acidimicrobiia bacterium]
MTSNDLPVPPRAIQRPVELTAHGEVRLDPYYWMRERDNPDVLAYLEAENAYREALMAPLTPLQDAIFHEIKARVQETDASAPVPKGPYEYFSRTVEGLEYAMHCRRPVGTPGLPDPDATAGTAPETIVLDENV